MGAQARCRRSSKKVGSANPYAERGLDKFALVSAELEEKREKLVAHLGAELSLVRFAIGPDHCDWIPVIVCPTLSKAEIRTLKRTATRLITKDRAAISSASAHQFCTPEVSIGGRNVHDRSLTCYEVKGISDHTHDHDQPARMSAAHAEGAQICQISTLNYLIAASERCLWMAAFIFSIAVDIVSNAFLSKCYTDEAPPKRILPSTRQSKEESDNPSSNMSLNLSSLRPISTKRASMSAKDIKVTTPSHSTAHTEAPKTHSRCKKPGFSTAPSTPRDSRQLKRSFQASISFPTRSHLQDEAPPRTKDSKFLKSVSLPKASHSQDANSHVVRRSPTSATKETTLKNERKERAEMWGQALTGAGVALGLGGLVMGYIPAIVCVVCWWYVLPGLRTAAGDKPHVKSHHL